MTDVNESGTPETNDEILVERKKRILNPKTLVFLALSLSLVYFLVRKLDPGATLDAARNADPLLILASCAVYFANNFFKALRFRVMLGDFKIPFLDLYTITSYHNFFNQILPARTGELTYIYYLKKIGKADVSKGLHALVVTRIFDFIVISGIFICSAMMYFGKRTSPAMIAAGALFFIVSVVTLFNLKWLVVVCGRLIHLAAEKLGMRRRPVVDKIIGKIDSVTDEFSSFKTGRFVPMLALTSLCTWLTLYFLFYLTIRAFGIDIGIIQSVVGSTGGVLMNVLPINSFGSFGTMEAGWTGGFILAGMKEHDAIFTGFGYHFISFFASALIALICYLVMKIAKRQ